MPTFQTHDYGTGSLPGMAQQMWGQRQRDISRTESRAWNTGLEAIKSGTASDYDIDQMAKDQPRLAEQLKKMRDQVQAQSKQAKEKQDTELDNIQLNKQIKLSDLFNAYYDLSTKNPVFAKRAAQYGSALTGSPLTEQDVMNPEGMKDKAITRVSDAVQNLQRPYTQKNAKQMDSGIARMEAYLAKDKLIPRDQKDGFKKIIDEIKAKRDAEQNRIVTMTNKEGRVAKVPVKNIPEMMKKGFTRGTAPAKPTSDFERYQKDPKAFKKFKEETRTPPTDPSWQRKTRTYMDGGKQYKQDYDYNPKTAEERLVGKPYEARDFGSAIMQWLNTNDPKGLF